MYDIFGNFILLFYCRKLIDFDKRVVNKFAWMMFFYGIGGRDTISIDTSVFWYLALMLLCLNGNFCF